MHPSPPCALSPSRTPPVCALSLPPPLSLCTSPTHPTPPPPPSGSLLGVHSTGIRAGLLARGWYENPEKNSPHFELKWAVSSNDIDHLVLRPGQVVNHYKQAATITTKVCG